jgi:hypothetical protein
MEIYTHNLTRTTAFYRVLVAHSAYIHMYNDPLASAESITYFYFNGAHNNAFPMPKPTQFTVRNNQ